MTPDEHEVETTLKTNVGYVGDLISALGGIPLDRRIEIRDELPAIKPVIDEITLHEDGHVVIYIGGA